MKVAFLTKARPEVLQRIPKALPHVLLAAGPGDRYSQTCAAPCSTSSPISS